MLIKTSVISNAVRNLLGYGGGVHQGNAALLGYITEA